MLVVNLLQKKVEKYQFKSKDEEFEAEYFIRMTDNFTQFISELWRSKESWNKDNLKKAEKFYNRIKKDSNSPIVKGIELLLDDFKCMERHYHNFLKIVKWHMDEDDCSSDDENYINKNKNQEPVVCDASDGESEEAPVHCRDLNDKRITTKKYEVKNTQDGEEVETPAHESEEVKENKNETYEMKTTGEETKREVTDIKEDEKYEIKGHKQSYIKDESKKEDLKENVEQLRRRERPERKPVRWKSSLLLPRRWSLLTRYI